MDKRGDQMNKKLIYDVIIYDLGCLDLEYSEDNKYHMKMIIDNLKLLI